MASKTNSAAAATTDEGTGTVQDQQSSSTTYHPNFRSHRRHRRPWQVDWKDPQWTIQQQERPLDTRDGGGGDDDDGDENLIVVNATSCVVSKYEIPQHIMNEIYQASDQNENDGKQRYQREDSTADEVGEGDWILSVRLLAATPTTPSSHTYDQRSANTDHDRNFNLHIATHMQVEILRMTMDSTTTSSSPPSSSSIVDETAILNDDGKRRHLNVLFQKRLQWPETIDNDNVGVQDKEWNKWRGNQKHKKNKNWFISKVWKPLLGEIDEDERNDHQEDHSEPVSGDQPSPRHQDEDDQKDSEGQADQNSTSPISGDGNVQKAPATCESSVSNYSGTMATVYVDGIGDDVTSTLDGGGSHIRDDEDENDNDDLFRHLDMDSLGSTKGIISATFCRRPKHIQDYNQATPPYGNATVERSDAVDTIQMMNLGISPSNQSSTVSSSQATTGTVLKSDDSHKNDVSPIATSKKEYDIHLICMNHVGNVFVYNPWDLLLPPKPPTHSEQSQQKDDGDDFALLLFGQTLFDTLQQTWKPLSEPVAMIEPAVFASSTKAFPRSVGRHDEIGVVESSGQQPPSTVSHSNIHDIKNLEYHAGNCDDDKEEQEEQRDALDGSITCDRRSVNSEYSGKTGTTNSSDRHRQHDNRRNRRQHQRHRKQPRRNANPFFLWNPTFDASTINDATTINNQPLSIHPAGSGYIVILGHGIHQYKKSSKRNGISMGDVEETNEGLYSIASGSSDEQEWWLKSTNKDPTSNESGEVKVTSCHDATLVQTTEKDEGRSTTTFSSNRRRMDVLYRRGGFLTFVSTAHWSETRTLFLPFVPISSSFISNWMGSQWFLVTGTTHAVLVRLNATAKENASYGGETISVPIGSTPNPLIPNNSTSSNSFSYTEKEGGDVAPTMQISTTPPKRHSAEDDDETERLTVRKFQLLPIDIKLPGSIIPRLIAGPGSNVKPPSLLELYVEDDDKARQRALVLLKSFSHCTSKGTIALAHHPKDIAKIITQRADDGNSRIASMDSYDLRWWAQHRQGWSVVGNSKQVFFVCWEGSTLASGAYVREISPGHLGQFPVICQGIMALPDGEASSISNTISSERSPQTTPAISKIPFSTPIEDVIGSQIAWNSQVAKTPKDLIVEVMESLCQECMDTGKESKEQSLKRKKEILLQHCASWTQLEQKLEDRPLLQLQCE